MTATPESDDDLPRIEALQGFAADTTRWKPSPPIEERVLDTFEGLVPLEFRASDQTLEEFYEKGFQLYKTGKFKEALPHFQMLTMANPKHPKYYMAAAGCHQMMKEYHAAVGYYTLAAILDDKNPYPQYYLAGCLIKLEEPIQALVALEMGVNRCEELEHFKGLKDRMQIMILNLDKELEEKKAAGNFFPEKMEQKADLEDKKN